MSNPSPAPSPPLTCAIQWIDGAGRPTPDAGPAVGFARQPDDKENRIHPICAAHARRLPIPGWRFDLLIRINGVPYRAEATGHLHVALHPLQPAPGAKRAATPLHLDEMRGHPSHLALRHLCAAKGLHAPHIVLNPTPAP